MLWLTKFFTKGKTIKDAISYFFKLNNRMPDKLETIKIKNAFMEQNRPSNVIDITSRIKDEWWKARPKQGIKKADEDPTSVMYDRHTKEIEGIDTTEGGMGFYSELGDMMKKHRREELELAYDTMFNKILDQAKRIEADPKVLLEAELGKKLTGKETTTQLLELFKNRPKKASGGIARVGYLKGKIVKGILSLGKKKKPKINRKLTKDELDDLYEEFDEAVPYPMETVGDKEKFLKAVKDEEAYMFQQYKKGNLDPKPGEPGRKQFLEKKLEEMELSGDKRLMTIDEIEELSSFDLGTEMDEAIKKYKQKDIQQKRELQAFDVKDRTKQASGGLVDLLSL